MYILVATDTYFPHVNGNSIFTQRLVKGLIARGHTATIIAPSRGFWDETYERDGATIYGIGSIPLIPAMGFRACIPKVIQWRIDQILHEEKPDVIHVQGHFPISAAAMDSVEAKNIPIVGTNHFMPDNLTHYLHLPEQWEELAKEWTWKQCCRAFSRMDAVTTPTKIAAKLLKEAGFEKEILPISCGIDLERFKSGDRIAAGKKWNLPDVPRFLFVGRLDEEKHVDHIIRAFAQARKDVPMCLVLGGKGVLLEHLKALARELGVDQDIFFLGYVADDDLPMLYQAADCFIIASTAELQSIATMEAMSSGLPVIGVDAAALPDLIHHEENGILLSPDDIQSMTQAMKRIASNPTERIAFGLASRKIIEPHAIARTITLYEELYRSVIAKKQAALSQ
ncbi:MAG TPA: glycosyltransferase [Candidatus Andersenbacteria bacterium]|nr:glycosyltransferase [Candidatus Andersenbacteria bacterium]